jgi:hypothetical protein
MSERTRRRFARGPVLAALVLVVLVVAFLLLTMGGEGRPNSRASEPTTSAPQVVEVGETIDVPVGSESAVVLALTIHSVDVTATCPGRAEPVQAPEHEAFVVLDVSASVRGEAAENASPVRLGPEVFHIVTPDGDVHVETATSAAWACLEPEVLLPPFVQIGETAHGAVVLDSVSSGGAVRYAPGEGPGWEWQF